MEDPPGGVPPHIVHDDARVRRVGDIHENIITALLRLLLEAVKTPIPSSSPHNFIVDDQVRQQRVGP